MTIYQPGTNELTTMWVVTGLVFAAIMGVCHRLEALDQEEYQRKQTEFEAQMRQQLRASLAKRSEPAPKVCRDCGYFYGKAGLVCALHPYGVEEENCRDWENREGGHEQHK